MIREIKFRLTYKGKIVGYEVHIKADGSYLQILHSKLGDVGFDITRNPECFIPHDSKDQFTGVLTKNGQGVEIYENDKIKTKYGTLHFVELKDGSFVYSYNKDRPEQGTFLICKFSCEEDEIVGTKHANPGLLTQES